MTRAAAWQPRYTLTPAVARGLMDIEAARAVVEQHPLPPAAEAELRHRARAVLALFATNEHITTAPVAQVLGLSDRSARLLLNGWVADGWLVVTDPSNRRRRYGLSAKYRQYVARLSAKPRGART